MLVSLAATACESTKPDHSAALAALFAQFAGAEVRFAFGLGLGGAPEVGPRDTIRVSCAFAPESGYYACPVVSGNGLSTLRSYKLMDEQGQTITGYDPAKVDAIRFVNLYSGTATILGSRFSQPTSITVSGNSGVTMMGLLGGVPLLNGVGEVDSDWWTTSGKKSHTKTLQTITNVQPPGIAAASALSGGFPLGGTISSDISGHDTLGVALVPTTVITTFNGTTTVSVQVSRSGTSVTYHCTYFAPMPPSTQAFVVCEIA